MTVSKFFVTFASVATFIALPSVAFAGGSSGCHFHGSTPAPEKTVLECAAKRLDTLTSTGKIDSSWKEKTHESIEAVEVKSGKEWKVTYADPQAKDAKKSKLYLFFSQAGNFLAANHSGE